MLICFVMALQAMGLEVAWRRKRTSVVLPHRKVTGVAFPKGCCFSAEGRPTLPSGQVEERAISFSASGLWADRKETCNHPSPDPRSSLRFERLVSVAIGIETTPRATVLDATCPHYYVWCALWGA